MELPNIRLHRISLVHYHAPHQYTALCRFFIRRRKWRYSASKTRKASGIRLKLSTVTEQKPWLGLLPESPVKLAAGLHLKAINDQHFVSPKVGDSLSSQTEVYLLYDIAILLRLSYRVPIFPYPFRSYLPGIKRKASIAFSRVTGRSIVFQSLLQTFSATQRLRLFGGHAIYDFLPGVHKNSPRSFQCKFIPAAH